MEDNRLRNKPPAAEVWAARPGESQIVTVYEDDPQTPRMTKTRRPRCAQLSWTPSRANTRRPRLCPAGRPAAKAADSAAASAGPPAEAWQSWSTLPASARHSRDRLRSAKASGGRDQRGQPAHVQTAQTTRSQQARILR